MINPFKSKFVNYLFLLKSSIFPTPLISPWNKSKYPPWYCIFGINFLFIPLLYNAVIFIVLDVVVDACCRSVQRHDNMNVFYLCTPFASCFCLESTSPHSPATSVSEWLTTTTVSITEYRPVCLFFSFYIIVLWFLSIPLGSLTSSFIPRIHFL